MRRTAVAMRVGANADKNQFADFMEMGQKRKGKVSAKFLEKLKYLQQNRGRNYPGRVYNRPPPPVKE